MSRSDFPDRLDPVRSRQLAEAHPPPAADGPSLTRVAHERWRAGCSATRLRPAHDTIVVIRGGAMLLMANEIEQIAQPGDVLILPRGRDRHLLTPRRTGCEILIANGLSPSPAIGTALRRLDDEARCLEVEHLLSEALRHGQAGAPDIAHAYYRCCCALIAPTTDAGSSKAARTWRHCQDTLNDCFLQVTSIQEAAARCGIDPDHLNRLCKRFSGQRITTWLRGLRMSWVAGQVLADQRSDLASLADRLGYADAFSLSKAFKRQFGKSPQHWLRQLS